jgi:hypothetical protein
MGEIQNQTVHCLANQFRRTEIERVGGKAFACRVFKLEQLINLLDEEKARDLAYKMLHNCQQPELKGYILTWFDGMGYGQYTLNQILANIGERQAGSNNLELLALWD